MELDTQDIVIASFVVLLLMIIASIIFYRIGDVAVNVLQGNEVIDTFKFKADYKK